MSVLLDNSFVTSVPTAGTSFITLFIAVFPQIRLSRSPSPSIHLSSVLVKDTVPFMERGLSPRIPHRRAAQHLIVLLENLHFTLPLPADPYGFSEQQTTYIWVMFSYTENASLSTTSSRLYRPNLHLTATGRLNVSNTTR